MALNRRSLIKYIGSLAAYLGAPFSYFIAEDAESSILNKVKGRASDDNQWGMLIDIAKCEKGCDDCITECRKENNVPLFGDPKLDIHWIRMLNFKDKGIANSKTRRMPLFCNHCQHPPCQHVCPVAATFTRKDGIVLVDKHRCIGCRYCMVACPYKARSFVSKEPHHLSSDNINVPRRTHGVVEKCTLCVHLIDQGKEPACVRACNHKGNKGMLFGDLNDPNSALSKIIASGKTTRIRADLGTNPRIFYSNLG